LRRPRQWSNDRVCFIVPAVRKDRPFPVFSLRGRPDRHCFAPREVVDSTLVSYRPKTTLDTTLSCRYLISNVMFDVQNCRSQRIHNHLYLRIYALTVVKSRIYGPVGVGRTQHCATACIYGLRTVEYPGLSTSVERSTN